MINVCSYEISSYKYRFLFSVPLTRKNKAHDHIDENRVKTFERQKQCLSKVADINELRRHLTAVRNHIDEVKQHQQVPVSSESPSTFVPAHQRFAHLLDEKPVVNEPSSTPIKKIASPADLRRYVQVTENERVNRNENFNLSGKCFFFRKFS